MAEIKIYTVALQDRNSPSRMTVVWAKDSPQQPAVYLNVEEAEQYRRDMASKHPSEIYAVLVSTVDHDLITITEYHPKDPEQDATGRDRTRQDATGRLTGA